MCRRLPPPGCTRGPIAGGAGCYHGGCLPRPSKMMGGRETSKQTGTESRTEYHPHRNPSPAPSRLWERLRRGGAAIKGDDLFHQTGSQAAVRGTLRRAAGRRMAPRDRRKSAVRRTRMSRTIGKFDARWRDTRAAQNGVRTVYRERVERCTPERSDCRRAGTERASQPRPAWAGSKKGRG